MRPCLFTERPVDASSLSPQVVVAESCDVALDILDYETSDSFQYADIPIPVPASAD